MTRQIFITGGTGFFGKSLLAAWRDQPRPECELTILSRNPERFLLKFPEFSTLPHVRFLKGDVRNFTFPAEPFDEVIHAATPASATLEQENPEEMYSIIVDGTRHVINFCRKSGVKRMLFTSSGAVYGPQEPEYERLAETHPCRPVTAYGKGKLAAEQLCLESGIPTVIARCFAFIGPYLPLDIHFAAGNFLRDALENRPIIIRGDGRPLRSYLHSDDLVRFLWKLLETGVPGSICNVGGDRAVSIAELATLCAKLRTPALPVTILGISGDGPPPRYVPDLTRAKREFGLIPQIDLETALRRTFDFHRK